MDRETQIQVDRIKEVIVHKLKDKELISLYLGGTVPSKDRIPSSDIDTLGIVESDFDFREEEKVNCYLRKHLGKEIRIETAFRQNIGNSNIHSTIHKPVQYCAILSYLLLNIFDAPIIYF